MPIMEDKFVINIGRQLGSGGKAVGEAVARRLGIGVYDKQLINLAAEQSGLCPEVFERVDEKESRNLFSTLVAYLRSPFVGSEYAGSNVLSNDALFKIQSDGSATSPRASHVFSSAAVPTTSCATIRGR